MIPCSVWMTETSIPARELADQGAALVDQCARILVHIFKVGNLLIEGGNLGREGVDVADGLDDVQVKIAVLRL